MLRWTVPIVMLLSACGGELVDIASDEAPPVDHRQELVEMENDLIDWDCAFRPYQSEQWYDKYEELCRFHRKHGHCGVPPSDAALYRWLKRQRHQYRLKCEGKPSPISPMVRNQSHGDSAGEPAGPKKKGMRAASPGVIP